MTAEPVAPPLPVKRVAILTVAVTLVGIALAWCFLSMRAVMDVGGACADGGPYVSAQPCPDGFWSDPWQWGYIVCGVVFELMALPALYVLLPIPGTSTWLPPTAKQRGPGARWWFAYLVLGVGGIALGYVTFQAAS